MVSKKEEMELRKDRILAKVIGQYIRTVAPVGSAFIAQEFGYEVSSATIRNILAELEEKGFLTHPHTSAGRVPTQRGYRYYVDHLMDEIQLLREEQEHIRVEYEREKVELDNLLEMTSVIISDITHYTGIVSVDGWDNRLFCRGTNYVVQYPDPQNVEKISNILEALDKKQKVLEVINKNLVNRIDILIGHEINFEPISDCSIVVSQYKLKEGHSGRIAVLGPTRMNYQKVVSALMYISELMEETA